MTTALSETISEQISAGRSDAKCVLAHRAASYIEQHYTEKFSLNHMAEDLYINKIYLAKSFKSVTGTTLLSYHNECRCREARRLLSETKLPIDIIGAQVGFVTASHFSRIFKEKNACTPSEYRRSSYSA